MKQITHEEARKQATIYLPHEETFWNNYITQQEKKNKLLELYQKYHKDIKTNDIEDINQRIIAINLKCKERIDIMKKIKSLEEELK